MTRLLEAACGVLAGVALFAIMALTFFDVGGRKLLGESIPGSLELTELLMVVVIFAALPLVSLRGEHVLFDSLDPYLPAWTRHLQGVLVHALSAALLLGLGVLMWGAAADFATAGETTAQLKLSKAPFIYGMSLLCASTGLIHLALMLRPSRSAEGEVGVL